MSRRKGKKGRSRTARATQPSRAKIDRAIALSQKAEALYHAEDAQAAVEKLEQAVQLVSQISNAHYLLALCYKRLGQTEKAVRAAETELRLNSAHQKAKELLAGLKYRPTGREALELAFDGGSPPVSWPSVSLCMIVKDEEEYLAGCLESVGDFADEIIIVDTGSTDRTVEIAEEFGARVEYFKWIDDFSAARNQSIKYAQGEWVFWMDADDRISPEDLTRLKNALASDRADAYVCRIVSQLGGRRRSTVASDHLRLFRNGLGLQFEGPIHESVAPMAVRQGLTIARTNVAIEHTGYTSQEVKQEKARRNQAILLQHLAQEPDNLAWRHHLGVCLYMLGDWSGAIEHFEAALADPPDSLNVEVDVYQAYVLLLAAYDRLTRPDLARQALDQALEAYPNRRHLWTTAGMYYLGQDEPERAMAAFEQAKTLSAESDLRGMTWPDGLLEEYLVKTYLILDNLPAAKEVYLGWLSQQDQPVEPVSAEIRQQAQAMFKMKQYNQIIQLFEPVVSADPDALRMLVQACVYSQDWKGAARYLANAVALSQPLPGEWAALAGYTLKAENAISAHQFGRLALAQAHTEGSRGDGQNAALLNLMGVIAIERKDPSQALTYFVQAFLNDPNYQPASDNLAQASQKQGFTPEGAIREYGKRLISERDYTQAAETFATIIKISPQDVEAHKLLAVALQKLGREEDALLCWQTAQRISEPANQRTPALRARAGRRQQDSAGASVSESASQRTPALRARAGRRQQDSAGASVSKLAVG